MKNRLLGRKGFVDVLMLFGLVVLPALIFIVFLIIEYWKIMRIDNNLKLIATILTEKAVFATDPDRTKIFGNTFDKAKNYCPKGTTLTQPVFSDNDKGTVTVNVAYQFDGAFFKPKIQASVTHLSYHDVNLTANLECK